jgi:hypothetical protein
MNLMKNTKLTRVSNAVAAGTTDINSSEIDMQNFEGVVFIVAFGTITASAVTSIKAQQDTATGMASAADLEGTGVTVADDDDNQLFWLDIFRPQERFVRCVVDRATQNAVVDGIWAVQYGPKKKPTTHDSTTVGGGEVHASPAEGTA